MECVFSKYNDNNMSVYLDYFNPFPTEINLSREFSRNTFENLDRRELLL